MKKYSILPLFLALFLFNKSNAQSILITPSDTVYSIDTVNNLYDIVDEYIFLHNTTADSIKIAWRMVSDTTPDGWSLQLCDNQNCYDLSINNVLRTSLPVAPGDSINMHAEFVASCASGLGLMNISARIVGDTSAALIFTYKASITATCINGISGVPGWDQVAVFPNPSTGKATISGLDPAHTSAVQILNMLGEAVITQNNISSTTVSLNIEKLAAGVYFAKVIDKQGRGVTTKKVIKQ